MYRLGVVSQKYLTKYEKYKNLYNILLLYRYGSFLVTLALYYFTAPHNQGLQKVVVIAGLVLAYTTITLLYYYHRSNTKNILILGIFETISNSFFLMISGGFSSPFIWFFISTIFITSINISYFIAILYAATYFITATISTLIVLRPMNDYDVLRLSFNTALSYITVVFVILQLIRYIIKLEEKSECLSKTNIELANQKLKTENALKYCLELYDTVNMFTLHEDTAILQELVKHMEILTGVQQLMFIQLSPKNKRGDHVSSGLTGEEETIVLRKTLDFIDNSKADIKPGYYYSDEKYCIHYVMYEDNLYGVFVLVSNINSFLNDLGSKVIQINRNDEYALNKNDIISVFIHIAGVILKKLEFDEMEEKLLISEEQNRIANEIHDLILQKLFAISCKLYVMTIDNKVTSIDEIREELSGVKQSVDITMKELREAIYGFSLDKNGDDTFKNKLYQYVEEIKYLQNIDINIIFEGDTQKLKAYQKHGLYRAICEAINNAVRHGKAKHIDVKIVINNAVTTVQIKDDGEGFDMNDYKRKHENGLGLNNIYRIIEMNKGNMEIMSNKTGGTKIDITLPHNPAV